MDIIFDEKPGEVYDIFSSLWLMNNYEYYEEQKKNFSIYKSNSFDEMIYNTSKNENFDKKNVNRYFSYRELEPNIVFLYEMWKHSTIDEYLDFFKNMDEFEVRKKIIMLIMKAVKDQKEENEIEELASNDKNVIDYIEDKDINVGLKWEISLLLNNKQKYIYDYVEFIKEYLDDYKILNKERKKVMTEFNDYLKQNIKESGLEFINEILDHIVNLDKFDKMYITTSASISFYISQIVEENACYIVLGPYMLNKDRKDKSEICKKLTVIRNVVDDTRFYIIKQLMEKDCYGQEIAEKNEITKSTVSHHMDFLISIGVVSVKKSGKKIYYSLNKDALRNALQFLTNEFRL